MSHMFSGEGRSEPIKINPFTDRKSGLGKEADNLEQSRKRVRMEHARISNYKVTLGDLKFNSTILEPRVLISSV